MSPITWQGVCRGCHARHTVSCARATENAQQRFTISCANCETHDVHMAVKVPHRLQPTGEASRDNLVQARLGLRAGEQ